MIDQQEVVDADTRPFVLVVAVDLSDTDSSGFALDQAARIAMRIPESVMHVVHVTPKDDEAEVARLAGLLRLYMAEKSALLGGVARQSVGIHVRHGDAAKEIAQLSRDVQADVVVVGTHRGPHLRTLVLGSTAERVMAATACPVVIAGPRPRPQPSHVIVIDPPCPDCVQTRQATGGKSFWCQRHSQREYRRHLYSYRGELPFESHDSSVTATGVD
jgi:nucleotide-binding universal stress UspA family protein